MTPAHPPDRCILFTTDLNYMFPTLVSAIQARRHAARTTTDVAIFCLRLQPETEDLFSRICDQENLKIFYLEPDVIEGQTAMLARLFLDRFVPPQYTQCLYLDSDVHINGSLDPLMDLDLPAGKFLAANDPFTFLLEDRGSLSASLRAHLRSLGLTAQQSSDYFNSGVLRMCRDGWNNIGLDAWERFRKNHTVSRFPDQDVLNLAGAEHRLLMSMEWNFPTFLRNARLRDILTPTIEHFMSNPKPWHGAFPPWSLEAHLPYRNAVAQYPPLLPYSRTMTPARQAAYRLKQHGKRALETITWGLSARRARILAYEQRCVRTGSPTPTP